VAVMATPLLGAVVSNDVDEHIAPLVLAATLIGNVRLDSQIDESQILDRIAGGINAPHDTEAFAMVHITTQLLELGTECWKDEVFSIQNISIQLLVCSPS
jgi:hypothetical protein